MKVAMLTTIGNNCGIAAYTRALLAELQDISDVTVVPIVVGKQDVVYYTAHAEILNQADVIHIQHEHSFWGGILPNKSAFWTLRYLLRKPLVITAHTTTSLRMLLKTDAERRPFHRIAKELLLRKTGYRDSVETAPFVTSRCIVHTDEAKSDLIERGARANYLHVLPAGVPLVQKSLDGGMGFKHQFKLQGKRVVSLFGFIAPNKGYELTLEVLRELPNDVILIIAGGVRADDMLAYEESLKSLITASGLSHRVVITGYLTDAEISNLMAASDVVVAPHLYATGSYSVMVPLAYGKAIVASDLACFREIQERGHCIDLFQAGDASSLTTALQGMLNNQDHRHDIETAASNYALKYSWKAVAQATLNIYEEAQADELRLAHHHGPTHRGKS